MEGVVGNRVAVLGLGYVGLAIAVAAAEAGFDVIGVDPDSELVGRIRDPAAAFVRGVDSQQIVAATASGRFQAITTPQPHAEADVVLISVPTPLSDDAPDLEHVRRAAAVAGRIVAAPGLVILESTSYPGTTEDVVVPIVERAAGRHVGPDLMVGFSPERIDPGREDWTLTTTPRLVAGVNERSLDETDRFYSRVVERTVRMVGTREAEMAKLVENTYRHVNIALVNELTVAGREMGIDMRNVLDGASTKPFGYTPFRPGPGVGGHCLPVDPTFLSWKLDDMLGRSSRFVELANEVNGAMADHVVDRVRASLERRSIDPSRATAVVLGVAYKPNSDDCRESPAIRIVQRLVELGTTVYVYDPCVGAIDVAADVRRLDALDADVLASSDAVLLVTDHDEIDLDAVVGSSRYVFDARHRVSGPNVEAL